MKTMRMLIALTVVLLIAGCTDAPTAPVGNQLVLTPADVTGTTVKQTPGGVVVQAVLTSAAQKRLAEVTKANVGKQIEVVVDAEVVSRPMVREAIESTYIEIRCETPEQAQSVAASLKK